MVPVKVTVAMGREIVPLEQVKDPRVREGLERAAANVGGALATVLCPKHRIGPRNVRLHVDARGQASFEYESCCEVLGKLVETSSFLAVEAGPPPHRP